MPLEFFIPTCPLTGLPTAGRATTEAIGIDSDVLYTFKPIGSAIFNFTAALNISHLVMQGVFKPRLDLAGLCRQAAEKGEPSIVITNEIFSKLQISVPHTFEAKQSHFMQLLYDSGGSEYKSRTINTLEDFPMAFASDAEEFYRILESLIDERFIRYDENWVVAGDFEGDIQTLYNNVLITPAGKRSLNKSSNIYPMPSNNFHFGDSANVNLIQGDGATQNNITGNNSSANIASGGHNTQSNDIGQPRSLQELMTQLNKELANSIFDSYRDEINDELNRIKLLLQKPEPKKSLINRSFDYLKEMAADSAGAVAAQSVVELLKHAPILIAAAHLG